MTTPASGVSATSSQSERANRFKALHEAPGAFVIPNVWDAGSARIVAGLGYQALATSSGAAAAVLGRRDGHISREEALTQIRSIVSAIDLPLSADLEKGFGEAPEVVAETIRLGAEAGLVGGSIEDSTGKKENPIYDINKATERVRAAAEAAQRLPFKFTLTARSENFLHGKSDLDDTIKRLQAYESAGADVLFAPGLPDLAAVRTVCSALSKPVNFMVGIIGRSFTVKELEEAGVKRISLAGSIYRAAMGGLVEAVKEIKESGTFNYLNRAMASADLGAFMQSED
jgi:2-methylisocitrate lyase-like PEP mutase family enzyme